MNLRLAFPPSTRLAFRFLALFVATLAAASAATVPLSTALDGAGLTWTSGGTDTSASGTPLSPAWTGQTTISQDGVDAARSPVLVASEAESWIETTVTGPGTLTWQWRLDLSDNLASALELRIGNDPSIRQLLFQTTPWTAASEILSESGPVTVRWRFVRTYEAEDAGNDAAFVDGVSFAPFGPPVLQSATAVNARGFTARWNALPAATEYVIEISTSADFSNFTTTETIPAPASSFVLTGLEPLTTYHYRLVARGPELLEATSSPAAVTLPAIQRPANDAFASATALSGLSGSVSATMLDATVQTDEPAIHQASIWFTWTAPSAGRWSFLATPTTEDSFAPALYLYTGSSLANLTEIAMDQGAGLLEFDTVAGVTYRLALDSTFGVQGPLTLTWRQLAAHTPPGNDSFAGASLISGRTGNASGSNAHATTQSGEPASAGGGHTIWWRWIATDTGLATFNASGKDASDQAFAATLAAYTGSSLTTLGLVEDGVSTLSFPAVAGTTYYLALDGVSDAQGDLALSWSIIVASTAQTITFNPLSDVGRNAEPFNVFAASDSGLPVTITVVSGPATLNNGLLTLTGSTGDVKLRATQAGDGVYLPATLDKTFTVHNTPTNDAFANATTLTSSPVNGSNLYASTQEFDPFPASHSVWWLWTAPSVGVLNLDTAGSAIPTTLTVLTGTSDENFETIIDDTRPGVRAKVSFPVAAGVTYRIAVDAYDNLQGAITLAWSFVPPSRPQTITFDSLPDVGLDAPSFSLIATASSDLPVFFRLDGATPAATLEDGFLTLTGKPGLVKLIASQPGDAYYAAAPLVARSFTVRPPPTNDAFADALLLSGTVVTGSNIDASAQAFDPYPASHSVWWMWTAPSIGVLSLDTADSAIPVALSVVTGPSAENLEIVASDVRPGARGKVEFPVVAGTTYRIALDALDNQQGALSLKWSFAKPSRPQTIAFEALPNLTAGDPAFTLDATASSTLPVTFTVTGPATLEDGIVTLTNRTGTVKIVASQSGDAYYAPAPPVERTFTVAKAPALKITFADLRQTYDGTERSVIALTDLPPRYADLVVTYSGPGHPASTTAPRAAGTYTVVATADDSTQTAKLVIEKATLTVTALDARKLAGQDNPPLELSYSGFQGGDDETALSRLPVLKTKATKTSPGNADGYPITASGAQAANYLFTYVPGTLHVDTFSGRYEALLNDPVTELPVAKLELTIASSGTSFTGKLTLPTETAVVSIKGALTLDATTDTATTILPFTTKTNLYVLSLNLPLAGDFEASLTHKGDAFGSTASGHPVFVPAPKEKLTWSGAHTALFRDPIALDSVLDPDPESPPPPDVPAPAGSGHALATIDAKGNLKLVGRLADGAPLTATLAPDTTGAYRLFALPYPKRLHSQIAGTLPFAEHPDLAPRRYVSSAAGQSVYWTKAALPSNVKTPDKSYRAGFGPLALTVTIDPWLPPVVAKKATKTSPAAPAITLAQRLDLPTDSLGAAEFVPDFGSADLDLGQLVLQLPSRLSLSAKNAVTVVAPLTTPPNISKFSLKVTPTTGAFSGSFTLSDIVSAPTPKKPDATKTIARKVTFAGVLRQAPDGEMAKWFGAGYFLLPALPGATDTAQPSGDFELRAP